MNALKGEFNVKTLIFDMSKHIKIDDKQTNKQNRIHKL